MGCSRVVCVVNLIKSVTMDSFGQSISYGMKKPKTSSFPFLHVSSIFVVCFSLHYEELN